MVQITLTVLSLYLYGFDTIKMFIPTGVPLLVAFFLLPIEIVSYLSRIISLAVRLFANMFAGHCVLQILSVFMVSTITFLG
jgi:F-type H+-transporting ATPase subunit a